MKRKIDRISKEELPRSLKWSEVTQSCPTLCNPVDCSSPGSSVHGILQARILEWVGAPYATEDQWRNNSRKNEGMEPKQKQYPAVDVTGDRSKVWCCKEQYCIRTWNVRSMNQGKLEVAKQEMARVNVDILGISKLKWTGMGEFKSDDHYIYYCGQESLRRNGVVIIVNKCNTWKQSQKRQKDLCSLPRQTISVFLPWEPHDQYEKAKW